MTLLWASCQLTGTGFHWTLRRKDPKPSSCQPLCFLLSLVGLISFLPFVTARNVLLVSLTRAKAMAIAMFCWNNQPDTSFYCNKIHEFSCNNQVHPSWGKVVQWLKISLTAECSCLCVERERKEKQHGFSPASASITEWEYSIWEWQYWDLLLE